MMTSMSGTMNDLELVPLSEDNLNDLIEIAARSRAIDPYQTRLTREEARAYSILDPDFDLNGLWLVHLEGKAVGFGGALIEKNRLDAGLDDGFVEVDVLPEYRGRGIEQFLLTRSLDHLRSKGIRMARARSLAIDEWRNNFLIAGAFHEAHRVYSLVRAGNSKPLHVAAPDGFEIERKNLTDCSDDDIIAINDAYNDSFRDHFRSGPENYERMINQRNSGSEKIVISLGMDGKKIAGICITEVSPVRTRSGFMDAGWIEFLGIRPVYRGRGLGTALLVDGIECLLDMGMNSLYMFVYAENSRALGMYRSLGFINDLDSIWWHRKLQNED